MGKTNDKIARVAVESGPWAWTLFAGYIGAVIYFFQLDPSFWGFVLALIKAAFWPAFVLYEVLTALGVA
ncbi:MAG: hypothetical protein ACO1N2_00270 [Candidatus Saccharimonadota bacterium]|jgi:hypothetical protein